MTKDHANDASKLQKEAKASARALAEATSSAGIISREMSNAASGLQKANIKAKELKTLFKGFEHQSSVPFSNAAREIGNMSHEFGGVVGAAKRTYDMLYSIADEVKRQRVEATGYAAAMGGSVEHVRKMRNEFEYWDKATGAREGWSDSLFHDLKNLGMNAGFAEKMMMKFHQAWAPENLGDSTQLLASSFVKLNQQALQMSISGQKMRLNRRQIQELFARDRGLLIKVNEELKKSAQSFYDIQDINRIIGATMDDNQKKVINPDTVKPKWDLFVDDLKTGISSAVTYSEKGVGELYANTKSMLGYADAVMRGDTNGAMGALDEMAKTDFVKSAMALINKQNDMKPSTARLSSDDIAGSEWSGSSRGKVRRDASGGVIGIDSTATLQSQLAALDSQQSAVRTWAMQMQDNGANAVNGLRKGVESADPAELGRWVGKMFSDGFIDITQIHSPSKLFAGHGANLIRGTVQGVEAETPKLHQAIKSSIPDMASGGSSGPSLSIGAIHFGGTNIQTNSEASGEELGENYGAAHAMMLIHSLEVASRQMGVRR